MDHSPSSADSGPAGTRRRAGASGGPPLRDGPRAEPVDGGHLEAQVSRRAGAGGVANQGRGVQVVQRVGCSTWTPLPLARSEASSPTRRDTRFRSGCPGSGRPAACCSSGRPAACCSRAITPGQQWSTTRHHDAASRRPRLLTAHRTQPSKLPCGFDSRRPLHRLEPRSEA
jgi:hypothetical protein